MTSAKINLINVFISSTSFRSTSLGDRDPAREAQVSVFAVSLGNGLTAPVGGAVLVFGTVVRTDEAERDVDRDPARAGLALDIIVGCRADLPAHRHRVLSDSDRGRSAGDQDDAGCDRER